MPSKIDSPGVMPASWRTSQEISDLMTDRIDASPEERVEIDARIAELRKRWAEEFRREARR